MNRPLVIKASLIWIGILSAFASYGQLVQLAQAPLGVLPMQYNSSFAGQAEGPRFSSSISFEPRNKVNNWYQYDLYTSYDQFIPAIRSGIGITTGFNTSYRPSAESTNYHLAVGISPKFSLKGMYTLSPSLDITTNMGRISTQDSSY